MPVDLRKTARRGNFNEQEDDSIYIWVTLCLVDYPWVCSSADQIYEGARVN